MSSPCDVAVPKPAIYDPLLERDRRIEELMRQLGRAFTRISDLETRVWLSENRERARHGNRALLRRRRAA